MNTAVKLGAYAAGLAVAFGTALGAGAAVGPVGPVSVAGQADTAGAGHDASAAPAGAAGTQTGGVPGGLAVSQDGYTLVPATDLHPAGRPTPFRFTIVGPDGRPVTGYLPEHERDLHLIVVRRDLSRYQHLHPVLGPDGTWTQQLTLPVAGDYRVFADFAPAADADRPLTLGVDLHAAGAYAPTLLPVPARTATVDGYTVTLDGHLRAGQSSPLALTVSRGGRPVSDLQPYLGAHGHLVALRDGDLAYLHVHPEGAPGDGTTPPGPQIRFLAEVPTAGTYRLYLDFQHAGVVRTAELTAIATGATPATQSAPEPGDGHGADGHSH